MAALCGPLSLANHPLSSFTTMTLTDYPWRRSTGTFSMEPFHHSGPRACNETGASQKMKHVEDANPRCPHCHRRSLIASLGGLLSLSSNQVVHASTPFTDPLNRMKAVHPSRPEWYQELYAYSMSKGMQSYEVKMTGYKISLFKHIEQNVKNILELGIGTGPNMKFYARIPDINVVGVDPNSHMEKYAHSAASAAGLKDSQFEFRLGVGEALPAKDSSFDTVVCTLVLCSVRDITATLREIQRVLKPGGCFLFIEHVAAPDDSDLRFWQNLLDPLQQVLADGCHLTRDTLSFIQQGEFSTIDAERVTVSGLSLLSPHVIGIAQKQ